MSETFPPSDSGAESSPADDGKPIQLSDIQGAALRGQADGVYIRQSDDPQGYGYGDPDHPGFAGMERAQDELGGAGATQLGPDSEGAAPEEMRPSIPMDRNSRPGVHDGDLRV